MQAFGEPEPLEAAWELDLAEFKEVFQALARETLAAVRKGVA